MKCPGCWLACHLYQIGHMRQSSMCFFVICAALAAYSNIVGFATRQNGFIGRSRFANTLVIVTVGFDDYCCCYLICDRCALPIDPQLCASWTTTHDWIAHHNFDDCCSMVADYPNCHFRRNLNEMLNDCVLVDGSNLSCLDFAHHHGNNYPLVCLNVVRVLP